MDTTFLSKLLIKTSSSKKGIHVDDLPSASSVGTEKKVLVIPPGLSNDLVRRFADSGAVVADHLDHNYPEDSKDVFAKTVESVKPQVIVCGSRGTRLLECCACHVDTVILFAPTRLREFFEKRPTTTVFIIHGVHDTNEQIGFVRQLVEQQQATHLIEVDSEHSLSIDTQQFEKILNYCYYY